MRIKRRKVKQILADFFDLHICIDTISNAERLVSEALATFVQDIEKQLHVSDYAHFNETSHRRSGKTEWLWLS